MNGRLDVAISCAEVREREGKRDRRDIGEVKREQIEWKNKMCKRETERWNRL
mgnify:CR=1 FL=1